MPNIVIRVVSKKVKDGKLYNKKLEVTDIQDEYTFTAMDEHHILYDCLREKDCETVIPKSGNKVKILTKENKGKVGTLLERDKKKNTVQI